MVNCFDCGGKSRRGPIRAVFTALVISLASLMVFGLAGCACSATKDSVPESDPTSVESTDTLSEEPAVEPPAPSAVNEGKPIEEIADPANATRQTLMGAAHEYLGIPAEDKFIGWQCLVQGTTAVLDLQPAKGGERELLAFVDSGAGWKGAYRVKYLDSTAASLLEGAPQVTVALADAVAFMVPVEMDPGYAAAAKRANQEYGAPDVYAPTYMPEGFRLTKADRDFEYSDGVSTISIHPSVYGDWGEGPYPDTDISGLRIGDLSGSMDRDFESNYWHDVKGKRGPFLSAYRAFGDQNSYEIWIGSFGATPGMVAAVGESMVPVRP